MCHVFTAKPPSAKQEFDELHRLLGTAKVAEVLGRRPESISRLKSRDRYTRSLERVIDDVWSVVHVATCRARWDDEQIRSFLLLRQPALELRPAAELIRAGETELVLQCVLAEGSASSTPSRLDGVGESARQRARGPVDERARAQAQRRLAERGLAGLDRDRLLAAGHEAWGQGGRDSA